MQTVEIPLITSPLEIGIRVGVFASYLRSPDGRKVLRFYGWGVYEGDYPLGDEVGTEPFQSKTEKVAYFDATGEICTPRIRMDDGVVTWGLLTWFDEAEMIEELLQHADVVYTVDLKVRMDWFKQEQRHIDEYQDAVAKINVFEHTTT